MIEEEKQLENPQGSTEKAPEEVEPAANTPNGSPEESNSQTNTVSELDAEAAALQAFAEAMATAEAEVKEKESTQQQQQPEEAASSVVIEALFQENERLRGQIEEYKNQYARLAADFENYRRRTQKEKEELELIVKCATIKEILPVVDNFERARAQIKPQTDGEMNIHKSYQSVYKLLVDCLKKIGVSPMRPEGQPFDPNLHEAIMRETTDQHPEGTVIEELMRGYVLGDRVLRHAMVKVAAAPETSTNSTSEESSSEVSSQT
ncbi:MAG TPA: nucleotide exchange factor GrpE [Oscillatoriaceae cyanobacterium M7585_C2015_266]|nr:nucleotide exchange factor GrpE [Oscillatoriaceae cyanobacterium M7585_C2015_266]